MNIPMNIRSLWTLDKRQSWTVLALWATALFWAVTSSQQVFSFVSQNFLVQLLLSGGPMYLVLIYIAYTCPKKKPLEEQEDKP